MDTAGDVGPVVVCGVAGAGKTTVGVALAQRLGVPFADADRGPWLARVGAWLADHPDGVMACSALRRDHRDRLRQAAPTVRFLPLEADRQTLVERLRQRSDHFMPPTLLDSQLAAWEPPGDDEAAIRCP